MTDIARRALLVGINAYDQLQGLESCVADALAMKRVLEFHEDGSPNFTCHLLLAPHQPPSASVWEAPPERVITTLLREELKKLFDFEDTVLFYFSGHGYDGQNGTYLVTQNGDRHIPGIPMDELLNMANASRAREVFLIIDCCSAGALGDVTSSPQPGSATFGQQIEDRILREGVTVLAAARHGQAAVEVNGHGVFTYLVVGALKGGAADVRGLISAASVYAYAEQALSAWDQRPLYKSNASRLPTIRRYTPRVTDEQLRLLSIHFPVSTEPYALDPTYEATNPGHDPDHVAIFRLFKVYQVAGLLHPIADTDLYFAAIHSTSVALTPLGQFYWELFKKQSATPPTASLALERMVRPDDETVARLFHEKYEEHAVAFNYQTRPGTRKPWDDLPDRNKHLMIATTRDVLNILYRSEQKKPETTEPETTEEG